MLRAGSANDPEGSQLDAPIDVVGKYLGDPDAHGNAHANARARSMPPISETSFVVSWRQNVNGHWVKIAHRVTVFPPLGRAAEALEGPRAGSKMFAVYTPKGAMTEVAVYREMRSESVPAAQRESMIRSDWENACTEDAAGLREFAKSHA